MALQKEIITTQGIPTTYHRVLAVHDYSKLNPPKAHIDVASYASEEAATQGYAFVEVYQFEFADEAYPFTADGAVKEDAYAAIKTLPEFAGAEDV